MKKLQIKLLIISLFAASLLCFGVINIVFAEHQKNSEKNNVWFRWAFGALLGNENNRKLVSISRDTQLKTGDQFKMMVEMKKKCFIYLIYHGGQGELQLLFPDTVERFPDNYKTPERHYIPQGDLWFALDENTGLEKFYLLASAKRLTRLEALLNNYKSVGSVEKKDLSAKIIKEIKQLKRQHRKFQAVAERPVSIGGTVRGVTKDPKAPVHDIVSIAVEISAADFYSRTFTIEHE